MLTRFEKLSLVLGTSLRHPTADLPAVGHHHRVSLTAAAPTSLAPRKQTPFPPQGCHTHPSTLFLLAHKTPPQ